MPMKIADASGIRSAEAAAVAHGVAEFQLMLDAGRQAAEFIDVLVRRHGFRRIVFLCGTGNNAGDALVAAAFLFGRHPVSLALLRGFEAFHGAAAEAVKLLPEELKRETGEPGAPPEFRSGDLLVDGILGIGIRGEVRREAALWIAAANASRLPVLALDLPSGMAPDTGVGLAPGGEAVRARWTLAFGAPKTGEFTAAGIGFSGALHVADIGLSEYLPDAALEAYTMLEAARDLPRYAPDIHKRRRGSALVMAGSSRYPGAAALATQGCLRAGAGVVRTLYPSGAAPALPAAAIPVPLSGLPEWSGFAADVLVAGPGWGDAYAPEYLERALAFPGRLLLDADALNLLSAHPILWKRRPSCVMTPHPGEVERLRRAFDIPEGLTRPELAAALSGRTGAVVVLKGARTVVAEASGRLSCNCSGSPALATAGSGDVLAGIIGGLLANGLPVYDAARLGAFIHGAAGERCGRGCIADDLPRAAATIIAEIENGLSKW